LPDREVGGPLEREELTELHYIAPVENVASIARRGILSHTLASRIDHTSIAMEEIQARRRVVVVPGGDPLHNYVNLYICARNPMLYKRRALHARLCVLRINPKVLDLEGVVVSDRNASSQYARFAPPPLGLRLISKEAVFSDFWTHPEDPIAEYRHKSIKCAEVLVPHRVPPELIMGGYVSCEATIDLLRPALARCGVSWHLTVNRHLFFL